MDFDLDGVSTFCKVFICPEFHDNRCCIDCQKQCEDVCLNSPEKCNITTDFLHSEYDNFDDEEDEEY